MKNEKLNFYGLLKKYNFENERFRLKQKNLYT